jgi:DNA-binding transcriptional MerR regulator
MSGEGGMARGFRVREFAELAGVTVKALHHYDRIDLLRPGRSTAGYRLYREADLERLEQIETLRLLGFSLKEVKAVLKGEAIDLPAALRLQGRAIEEKIAQLRRALQAIRAAEDAVASGQPPTSAILKRIIEVIDVESDIEAMKKYYSEAQWERYRQYYAIGPAPEWRSLYRDVLAVADGDPGSARAQEVADRWLALSIRSYSGDPEVQTDSPRAWADRENWPPAMRKRLADLRLEEVNAFITEAVRSSQKRYFNERGWKRYLELRDRTPEEYSRMWQARIDLFRQIEAAIDEEPSSDRAQALATEWTALMHQLSGDDPDVLSGLLTAWADRQHWPATLRWQTEGLHLLSSERFERAAAFIDAALAHQSRLA